MMWNGPLTPPDESVPEIDEINLTGPSFLIALPEFDFDAVAGAPSFLNLTFEQLVNMIKEDSTRVSSEAVVFEAVIRWVRHSKDRLQMLRPLMEHVRLSLLPIEYIREVVAQEDLMNYREEEGESCRILLQDTIAYLSSNAQARTTLTQSNGQLRRKRMSFDPPQALYIFGRSLRGFGPKDRYIDCFDFVTESWSRLEGAIPSICAGVTVFQGRIWFVGGGDSSIRACAKVFSFNPCTSGWRNEEPLSYGRRNLGVAVLDGCLCAAGGNDGAKVFNSTEVYSRDRCRGWSWRTFTPMLEKRTSFGLTVFGMELFAVGGLGEKQRKLRSVEFYESRTFRWTIAKWSLRTLRYPCSIGVIDELLYLVGGDRNQTTSVFNSATKTLSRLSSAPTRVGRNSSLAASSEYLYLVRGDDLGLAQPTLQRYDPKSDVWQCVPRPPGQQVDGTKAVVFNSMTSWGCSMECRPEGSPSSCLYDTIAGIEEHRMSNPRYQSLYDVL